MKKTLFTVVLMLCFSQIVYAENNFTLQTSTNIQNPINSTNSTINQSSKQGSALSTFCESLGNSFGNSSRQINNPASYVNNVSEVFTVASPQSDSAASGFLTGAAAALDPYLIEINGIRYMMIKDNNDNVFNSKDFLGINDTVNSIFKSLKPIDTNGDLKLTGKELSAAGIRLVRIGENGKLMYKDKSKDFKNSDVIFIYLTEVRKAYNNDGITGNFGFYDVVVKNSKGEKQLVTGIVTFETEEEILKYL